MAETRPIPDKVITDALTVLRSARIITGFRAEASDRGRRVWRITLSPGSVVRFSPIAANAFAIGAMAAVRAAEVRG